MRVLPIALLLAAAPAAAADQAWTALFISGPVAKTSRVLAWADVQYRFQPQDAAVVRPGIGYRVSPALDLYAGYARIETLRPGANVLEQRVWQQANYGIWRTSGLTLAGRTRLEQRFRGGDTGWRVRQWVRAAAPIAGTKLSAVASNEIFLALDDTRWGQRSGFDQNRAFAGAALQLAPKLRVEAGYLNQRISVRNAPDRSNDTASLSLFVAL